MGSLCWGLVWCARSGSSQSTLKSTNRMSSKHKSGCGSLDYVISVPVADMQLSRPRKELSTEHAHEHVREHAAMLHVASRHRVTASMANASAWHAAVQTRPHDLSCRVLDGICA